LTPAEIEAIEQAFDDIVAETGGEERAWREQARVLLPRSCRNRLAAG
jgi:hypothetical protein